MVDRLLPSDLEAEQATLGCVLLDPSCLGAVRAIVSPDAFFADPDHGRVFGAALELAEVGKPFDIVAIIDYLGGNSEARMSIEALLRRSMDLAVSSANAVYYAGIVARHRDRRRIILAGHQMVESAYDHDADPVAESAIHIETLQQLGLPNQMVTGPALTRLSDVAPEAVSWLWPDRIPLGKLSLVVGDPCLGKTWILCDMAARLSAGSFWPDARATRIAAGDVIVLTAEDGLSDTIRPRVDALLGDPSRIHVLTGVRRPGAKADAMFDLARDLSVLADAIEQTGAQLVLIDPLSAYFGKADGYRDTEVRAILAPVAELAERCGAAIVGIMHLGKSTGRQAIYRTNGSIAFTAAPRAVWAVAKHPQDPDARVLVNVKLNVGKPAPPWGFRIIDNVLAWDAGEATVDVELLLNPKPPGGNTGAAEEAESFLRETLADGPVPANDVIQSAKGNGISKTTLDRVKRRLGIKSTPVQTDDGKHWVWSLTANGSSSSTSPRSPHSEHGDLDDLGELPADADDFDRQRQSVFNKCNAELRKSMSDSNQDPEL